MNDEIKIKNNVSDPINLPDGCIFQDRCPDVSDECRIKKSELLMVEEDHYVACIKIPVN